MPVRVLSGERRRAAVRGTRLSRDARRILAAQAARAFAYGLGSVLIGLTLAERGLSNAAVGVVLASLLAGSALVSVLIARYGDRVGRRRCYELLFVVMALAGTVFALTGWLPALIVAGLTGTVSTDVVESGPFTSLEQAMLPHAAPGQERTRLFGTYNTVATLAGSFGALFALVGSSSKWLLVYPVAAAAGLLVSARLSSSVELGQELEEKPLPPLHRSRGIVLRLSGLFALDSFGGGFVPQTFIAYLFVRKYDASPHTLALVFFSIGILQAVSFQLAVRVAGQRGRVFHPVHKRARMAALAAIRAVDQRTQFAKVHEHFRNETRTRQLVDLARREAVKLLECVAGTAHAVHGTPAECGGHSEEVAHCSKRGSCSSFSSRRTS